MAGPADLLVSETDGFAADFTYYILPITGTLAATETGADAAAIAAAVEAEGALTATEAGADVAAFTIAHAAIVGLLVGAEAGIDTAAFVGNAVIAGVLAAPESGVDAAAFAIGHFVPPANLTLVGSRDGIASLASSRATFATLRGGM